MSQLNTCQIVGNANEFGWSQIHHFSPEAQPEAILLISIPVGEEDGIALGKDIITRFQEEYYINSQSQGLSGLKDVLLKISQQTPSFLSQEINVDLAAIVAHHGQVQICCVNDCSAYLYRNSNLSPLINSVTGKISAIRGEIKKQDAYLVATNSFFKTIPNKTLSACLKSDDLEQVKEIISPLVYKSENQEKQAAVLAKTDISQLSQNEFSQINQQNSDPNYMNTLNPEINNISSEKTKTSGKKFSLPKINFPKPHFKVPRFLKKVTVGQRRLNPAVELKDYNQTENHSKLTFIAAIGFLILLSISLFISWKKKSENDDQKLIRQTIVSSENKLNTALSLKELDLDKSLELARQAQEDIAKGMIVDPNNETLNQLNVQAEKIISLSGGDKVTPQQFFDLTILGENSSGVDLFLDENELWILDPQGKRLTSININTKKTNLEAGGENIGQAKKVFIINNLIHLSDNESVERINTNDEHEKLFSADLSESNLLSNWGSNFYLVQDKDIYKYSPVDNGYSSGSSWIKGNVSFNWEEITSMAIDGNIWLLTKNGAIYKLASGVVDSNIDLNLNLRRADYLTASPLTDRIAFFDKEDSTLYVITKQGRMSAKMPLELEDVRDIAISTDGQQVFILSAKTVYTQSLSL